MLYLKQSTASQSVLIGPFVDDSDGTSAETGLSIANTDIRLSANGGNLAAKNSGGGTHDEAGWYSITLDATDTATVGRLQLHCKMSGALMVHAEFQVLEEIVYDALIGASAAGELAVKLSTQGKADVNAEADTALTDYDPPTKTELDSGFAALNDPTAATIADAVLDEALSGHVTAGSLGKAVADIETDATAILVDTAEIGTAGAGLTEAGGTGDQLTAVPWNASWDSEVQSEVQDAIEANHLDHLLAIAYDPASKPGAADALLNELVESDAGVARFTENALEQAPSGTGASAASIADAVWDEATSGHTTAGTFGEQLKTDVDAILADTGTDGVVVAAASKSGYSLTATTGLGNQTADITGNLSGSVGSVTGSVGSVTGAVGSVTGNVGGNVVGSVASVTGAINTAGGTITTLDGLDTAQDTQHAQTQSDIAGLNDLDAAGVRAAVGLNAADLDTQLDALPTAAENATAALTTQMTESYAANGTAPTLAQAQFAIHQMLMQFGIAGTSLTVRQLDDSTTAFVVTLDDATAPTDASRV